jgi:hypothetical protein
MTVPVLQQKLIHPTAHKGPFPVVREDIAELVECVFLDPTVWDIINPYYLSQVKEC